MELETDDSKSELALRRVAAWSAILGTSLLGAYFFAFLVYHSLRPTFSSGSWFIGIIDKHYAATIAVPLSAIASLCVVLALKTTAGAIEFEALGFKFRGASGPLVFWLICFLAMIWAVWLLWNR
jgi:hypothetical protein